MSDAGALGLQAAATPLDFYAQAKAQLGGTVTGAEDQALAAINSWPAEAQGAVLANLDASQQALLSTAMQGAQMVASGGVTPQTFFAVAGLVATELGGPVAGAVVGSMLVTLDAMKEAILSVAANLGIPTAHAIGRSSDFLCYSGWVKQGQVIPGGPADHGDGTPRNPGWQSVWEQLERLGPGNINCTPGPWTFGSIDSAAQNRWFAALQPGLNGAWAPGYLAQSWTGPWCEYHSLPKTDFRAFYYPLLYANFDFRYNCSPVAPVDDQQLLLKSADIWNRTHSNATVQRYAPADGTTIGGILAGFGTMNWIPGDPQQKQSVGAITVHAGPAISAVAPPRVIALHLPRGAIALHLPRGARVPTPATLDRSAAPPAKAGAGSNVGTVLAASALAIGAALLLKPKALRPILAKMGMR